ncbi:hypothetical protein [Sphingobium subterraneum]|uniref:Uncharacterized protein n=1 Tax=Sphingobium subterraneum TaxID=627688 RepID=A0A841IWB3_9SPHN|nr:hypothetical protein [Sphingobium subterraneum]MBB6122943.1 hypothetical protein [Sphingobium subterraneum]
MKHADTAADNLLPVLMGFAAGALIGFGAARSVRKPATSADRAALDDGSADKDLIDLLQKQQDQVSRGILELTIREGEPGAQQLNLAGQVAQLNLDLAKLQARLSLAQTNAAAIQFPGDATITALRTAAGDLEAAIGKATALDQLLAKVSAAIAVWKP